MVSERMHGYVFHRAWCAALVLLLLLPAAWAAAGTRPWVVGTYAYPQRDRASAIAPLAEYLAARGGHPVQVRVLPSPTAPLWRMDAFRNRFLDAYDR